MACTAAAAARFFEDFVEVGAGAFECGDEAKEDSSEEGDGKREKQDARIEGDFAGARKSFGQSGDDGFGAVNSEQQTERAADASEKQAFGEELAKHAKATGTEGDADGEFAGSAHGAGEKKIRDVGAGNEEQEADRGEKNDEQGLDVADDVVFQRDEDDAFVFVGFGIFLREMLRDGVHIGLRLHDGDAGFETADDVSAEVHAAIAEGEVGPLATEGVDIAALAVEGEVRRNDADDRVVRTVEGDRFSSDVEGGSEFAAPEAAAEHNHGCGAELIVGVSEQTAHHGMDAEEFEKFGRDHVAGDAFSGFSGAEEVVVFVAVHRQGGEGLIVALPVEEVGVVDGSAGDAGNGIVERDELAGVWVGERIEKDAVDDGEESGVGADAEGERENGDDGEERGLAEHAEGVTQVLKKGENGAPPGYAASDLKVRVKHEKQGEGNGDTWTGGAKKS